MMSFCNEDLNDYDAEIVRLQSQISHVQAQRKRVIDCKTQIHFLFSSFRRFPNEVLSLIFESTCTENLLREYPWPYNTEEPGTYSSLLVITNLPALVISAVCTRWRSLALASPTLWSQIKLEISLLEPHNDCHTVPSTLENGFMRTIQLYLDRSFNAPLSIILNTMERGCNDPPALKLLLDHTYRWKEFAYRGDCAKVDQLLGFDLPFPILEKVNLDLNEQGQPGGVTCFRNAPNLRSVAGGQISILSLAWNLTSLDTRLHEGEDMDLLRRYPALTTLKLRSSKKTFEPGIISLAKLESFTLMELYGSDRASLLENIFPTLTFPSLKELVILSEFLGLIWSQKVFSAFISRSTCIITSFSLSGLAISDLNLIAALRLLPSLAKLDIDGLEDPDGGAGGAGGSSITTHFILSLHGSSIDPLLPKLQSLSMEIYYTTFDDATFVDMISSRWLPSSQAAAIGIDRLRSVVLHFTQRKVDAEIYRPLWQMDEMGTGIVITGCSEKGVGMVGAEEFSELFIE